jgi:toxin ParE1/3/4
MTFEFHPEAETEFLEAVAYYESRAPGLGEDFIRTHGRLLKMMFAGA